MVLAHAGASGVGTAAVQLVRLLGAVPIVTAGSPEKVKMAEDLGAAAGFNYREEGFAERVDEFTGGERRRCADSFSCDCIAHWFVSLLVSESVCVFNKKHNNCRLEHLGLS